MKVISYSLFESESSALFERRAYIRGFYWNFRMNRLIYPDWRTVCFVQQSIYQEYREMFDLISSYGGKIVTMNKQPVLCEGMLWRMVPIWWPNVEVVLCRDSDAITTLREVRSVERWEFGVDVIGIIDNSSHGGLMGGMIGVDPVNFSKVFVDFDHLCSGFNLADRGSDQILLNTKMQTSGLKITIVNAREIPSNHSNPLWESDLVCRHIGSAGVVEMELLRFFKRFAADDNKIFQAMEKRFPDLFYWWI